MLQAWDKEKIWVPDGAQSHDLPDNGRVLAYLQDSGETHGELLQ